MVCKLHHTMSGTYTQEKCGEDSTPLSNAPEARCGLRHSGRRSAGSSSQAPYSSFRRKRQNSYISLLVLSKLQPLRWVAIWFQPLLREKIWKKRALGTRNSAYAPENKSLRCACCRYTVRRLNALRAAHSILYAEMSRRGKYLTYETP